MPLEPGLLTHVMLHTPEESSDWVEVMGHGADEEEALLDLWTTLVDREESAEAIEYVAAAYTKRTGRAPKPL